MKTDGLSGPRHVAGMTEKELIRACLMLAIRCLDLLNILQSSADTPRKSLWIVLMLPLLGVIIWYFASPRENITA